MLNATGQGPNPHRFFQNLFRDMLIVASSEDMPTLPSATIQNPVLEIYVLDYFVQYKYLLRNSE